MGHGSVHVADVPHAWRPWYRVGCARTRCSSAWLECFADAAGAKHFAGVIDAVERLVVPATCLLEIFRLVLRQRGESDALQAVAPLFAGPSLAGPILLE